MLTHSVTPDSPPHDRAALMLARATLYGGGPLIPAERARPDTLPLPEGTWSPTAPEWDATLRRMDLILYTDRVHQIVGTLRTHLERLPEDMYATTGVLSSPVATKWTYATGTVRVMALLHLAWSARHGHRPIDDDVVRDHEREEQAAHLQEAARTHEAHGGDAASWLDQGDDPARMPDHLGAHLAYQAVYPRGGAPAPPLRDLHVAVLLAQSAPPRAYGRLRITTPEPDHPCADCEGSGFAARSYGQMTSPGKTYDTVMAGEFCRICRGCGDADHHGCTDADHYDHTPTPAPDACPACAGRTWITARDGEIVMRMPCACAGPHLRPYERPTVETESI